MGAEASRTIVLSLVLALTACRSTVDRAWGTGDELRMRGEMIHACECDPYCPCPFGKDATYAQCRSLTVWVIDRGRESSTVLDGLTFAVSMTKAGKNVARAKGTWEGILLLPEQATEAQREAVTAFVRRRHGDGFSRLETRVLPTSLSSSEEALALTMGEVVELRLRGLPGAGGSITRIEDPPSHPMGMGTLYCGRAEEHRYDDGVVQWDFAGRNAYYGPFAVE